MQSTADKVLSACPNLKRQHDGSYRGACPYRSDSNSNGFVLTIDDGEHGAFNDHARLEGGSLYELAAKLGIETPKGGRAQVDNSKLPYTGLEDYAVRHYSNLETYTAAGWAETKYQGKRALAYKVATGTRIRIIEGTEEQLKNPYRWLELGSQNCWYGLSRAIRIANEKSIPLVLCNGEASTVTAQAYGLPAFCGTGGEGAISDEMLTEFKTRWHGQVWICLDCDEKGKLASIAAKEKLGKGVQILDLNLSDKGDLSDFCGLHRHTALVALQSIAKPVYMPSEGEIENLIEFVSGNEVLSQFSKMVYEAPQLFGRVIKMPFASLRAAGGFAEYMTTKKIWLVGNTSGGGKTIFSETLCDEWNKLGYNVIYIGDEWTAMELTARRAQRASKSEHPVSYMDFLAYVDGKRAFTELEEHSISLSIRAIREREGQTFYMQTAQGAKSIPFLEDIMEAIANKIESLRDNHVRVDIVVLDYLSLYETRGKANNLEEYKVGIFKSYCKSLDVLGVSTVQVNKEAEDRVIRRGGFLTQHDLYWVRADKGNLISTMNRLYKTKAETHGIHNVDDSERFKPALDENGQPDASPNFAMVTVKNSVSSPFEYAYFHFDFSHMRVLEGLHPAYYFDKQLNQVLPKVYQTSVQLEDL